MSADDRKPPKGYQSRLEGVLKLRAYWEEAAQQELGHAKGLLREQEERYRCNTERLCDAADDLLTRQDANGLDASEMGLYHTYFRWKCAEVAQQYKSIQALSGLCEQKRVVLLEAMRERQVVEVIEERRKEIYRKALMKGEQAVTDEIAGRLRRNP